MCTASYLKRAFVGMAVMFTAILALGLPGSAVAATQHQIDHHHTIATQSKAGCGPGVPAADCQAAIHVFNFVLSHNFSPPQNYVGGKPYGNTDGKLPKSQGGYLEYDIYPKPPPGKPRGPQRLVIDKGNAQGNSWFTANHYGSFAQFFVTA